MSNRGEFRATTDQLIAIIDELRAIERKKQSTALGTPEFVDLAAKAADQAKLTFRWCQMQLEMAHEAAARLASGQETPNVHLIKVVPRPIDRILANWREAQFRLEIAHPGSPEALTAADDIERLREEYQVAHEAVLTTERQGGDAGPRSGSR
jgi:hypothetical protein